MNEPRRTDRYTRLWNSIAHPFSHSANFTKIIPLPHTLHRPTRISSVWDFGFSIQSMLQKLLRQQRIELYIGGLLPRTPRLLRTLPMPRVVLQIEPRTLVETVVAHLLAFHWNIIQGLWCGPWTAKGRNTSSGHRRTRTGSTTTSKYTVRP